MERLDAIYKIGAAAIGAAVGYLFGESTGLLLVLFWMVVIDYGSGLAAGYTEKTLSSKIGFKGIIKKVMIFVMVALAHLVDSALGTKNMFRDATIVFYMANELLSIFENVGRMGVPVPDRLMQAVEVLKGKSKEGDKK
ncbi:toxin secretion/phage lysis holin family protein [Geobacillus kaustophilus]|uniref:Toxin secretion/phage lysis holin family protein n=1 Tax=Geobacillus kaustophilus TaxID=1462 RepID=A0A0D8BNM1_GEOKU|nr:phage holin family protein [Geobacillus kaustophilus]KJE25725.1 toxin secretion/phage lysis holin family protein [Geobacillus kaustophilus]KJE32229.1 toxin secretion/phage lysis holin family protein [Geobacillus kaustophilus]